MPKHRSISGTTQSGKTTTEKILLGQERPPRLLIVDPDEDYDEGPDVELRCYSLDEMDEYLDGIKPDDTFSASIVPPIGQEPEIASIIALYAWHLRNVRLVIDEAETCLSAQRLAKRPDLGQNVWRCIKRGLKRGIEVDTIGQRIVDVAPIIRAETSGHEKFYLRLRGAGCLREVRAENPGKALDRVVTDLANYTMVRVPVHGPVERWNIVDGNPRKLVRVGQLELPSAAETEDE